MNKELIRLTESDLHRIVKESVLKILNEYGDTLNGQYALGAVMARSDARRRKAWQNSDFDKANKNAQVYDSAEKTSNRNIPQGIEYINDPRKKAMLNAKERGYSDYANKF